LKHARSVQKISSPDTRKWRTEIPNLYDDADLTPHEFRLLAHYCRVGNCWEAVRTSAKKCRMSPGMVVKTRESLKKKTFVALSLSQYGTYDIEVIDKWAENFERYRSQSEQRSRGEHRCSHSEHTVHTVNASVHTVNQRTTHEERPTAKAKKEPQQQQRDANVVLAKEPGITGFLQNQIQHHFGIEQSEAEKLATLTHVNEQYITHWKRFAARNVAESVASDENSDKHPIQLLRAGYYVTRFRKGDLPQ